jgi:hypothetical protein
VRSAAMISIRREMSREGFTGLELVLMLDGGEHDDSKAYSLLQVRDSHKTYYGIFLDMGFSQPLLAAMPTILDKKRQSALGSTGNHTKL